MRGKGAYRDWRGFPEPTFQNQLRAPNDWIVPGSLLRNPQHLTAAR